MWILYYNIFDFSARFLAHKNKAVGYLLQHNVAIAYVAVSVKFLFFNRIRCKFDWFFRYLVDVARHIILVEAQEADASFFHCKNSLKGSGDSTSMWESVDIILFAIMVFDSLK